MFQMRMDYEGENIFFRTLFWVVLSSLSAFFIKRCYDNLRILNLVTKFDGPESSFILGNWKLLNETPERLHTTLRQLAKKFYPHYKLRIFNYAAVNIISPEDCEIILGTRKHSSKSNIYLLLKRWLNDGLLLSKGDKWVRRRKILTPAFHFSILKDFLDVFNKECEKIVERLSKKCSQAIDVVPLCSQFALHSINETAMGHILDSTDQEQSKYLEAIYSMADIFLHILMRPWLYSPILYYFSSFYKIEMNFVKIMHNFTRNIINERMKTFKSISGFENLVNEKEVDDCDIYMGKKKRKLAMLDILLQAKHHGGQIDYDGICEEVDTFMFEGHDTTAVGLSYCLMLLANHPEIEEQVFQEIKSTLGERTKPTYNDLQHMELLERCIKESLRLYPSVYFISRVIDEDIVLHSGLVCPKDSIVLIQIYDLHRNAEIFPEPEKFDPDRFLPDNCQNRHPYAYIPFSAGPRNCIGQRFAMLEMKALLVGIIQRFKLTPVDTPETIVLRTEVTLRTKNGVKVKFNPRN